MLLTCDSLTSLPFGELLLSLTKLLTFMHSTSIAVLSRAGRSMEGIHALVFLRIFITAILEALEYLWQLKIQEGGDKDEH